MFVVTAILSCVIKIHGLFRSTKWRHFENVKLKLSQPSMHCIFLINYNFSMSENSLIQQGHMLIFGPNGSCEVGLSSDLII